VSEYETIRKVNVLNQVVLPKAWVKSKGIKKGSRVRVVYNGILKIIPLDEEPMILTSAEPLDIEPEKEKVVFVLGDKRVNAEIATIKRIVKKLGFEKTLTQIENELKKQFPTSSVDISHDMIKEILEKVSKHTYTKDSTK